MIVGILTFLLVVNCLFLILLVLIQLPKKEAGMGSAFGGGATEALFGAGSGNVLTKITKFAAGSFLSVCLILSVVIIKQNGDSSEIDAELEKASASAKAEAAEEALEASSTNSASTSPEFSATAEVFEGTNSVDEAEAKKLMDDFQVGTTLDDLVDKLESEATEGAEAAEEVIDDAVEAVEEVAQPEAEPETTAEPEPDEEASSTEGTGEPKS